MLVKDIMSQIVITIEEDSNLKKTARKMSDFDIGCLLVCKDDDLVGVVTDRDIVCRGLAVSDDIDAVCAGDIMSKNVIWCQENEAVEDAVRLMENNQVRRLPVLDNNKNLVGMLALGDISTHTSHELSGEAIEAISSSTHKTYPAKAG